MLGTLVLVFVWFLLAVFALVVLRSLLFLGAILWGAALHLTAPEDSFRREAAAPPPGPPDSTDDESSARVIP